MKKLILTALLLALQCFPETDVQRTNGGLNGRFWSKLNSSERLLFLMGFDEGMGLARPYGDIVKGLDRFYQEPENLLFPLGYALQIFNINANGATLAEVEAKLAQFRREIKVKEELLKGIRNVQ